MSKVCGKKILPRDFPINQAFGIVYVIYMYYFSLLIKLFKR